MEPYLSCHENLQLFSKFGYGSAQINRTSGFTLFFSSTISAAHISTPLAMPLIKVVKPSSIASSMAFLKMLHTSSSL